MTPEEVELLSELTIVIPTCNRPFELERAIEYWRDIPLTVHILDGSPNPLFLSGQIVSSSAKIYYHSVPTDVGEKLMENYARRLIKGMTLIETTYAALLADDDYFTTSGLLSALKVLDSEKKIDAVIGKCAMFFLENNKIKWEKKYLNWNPINSLESDLLSIRLDNDTGRYFVYYGILRTTALRNIHTRANYFVFSDFRINELIAHHLGLAYCRVKIIDRYLWCRQKAFHRNSSYDPVVRLSNSNEELLITETFVDAFTDIDPQVDHILAQVWANQKVQLIMDRLRSIDNRFQKRRDEINTSIKVKILIKDFLMRFLLSSPNYVLLVVLKVVPSRWKKSIEDASPPDFDDKHCLEKLFLMPREELRLRANI